MWFSKSQEEVIKEFNVDPSVGLSKEEAAKRLEQYGMNKLKGKPKSILSLFFSQLNDMLIYVLLELLAITIAIGEYSDVIIILLVVVLNAVIGVVQKLKQKSC